MRARRVVVGAEVDVLPPAITVKANLRLARALGADDLWLPDHVRHILPKSIWATSPMSRVVPDLDAWYDPTAVIARYCRPRGPRMGTFVTDAIRRTPADLARAWMTMHHFSGGNVVLGIGAGENMNVDPIGQSTSRSVSRLDDTLTAVRAAWAADGKFVTRSGPFHAWQDASFPPPYRKTAPPIWVGAVGPKACEVAGRHGDGWIYLHPNFEHWQASAKHIAAGAQQAGRDLDSTTWSLCGVALLSSNPDIFRSLCAAPFVQALALIMPASLWAAAGARHPFGDGFAGVHAYSYARDGNLLEGEMFRAAAPHVTPELCEFLFPSGPAERVVEHFVPFVESGLSHVVVTNFAPAAGFAIAADSLREQRKLNRLLKKLTPGTRKWIA